MINRVVIEGARIDTQPVEEQDGKTGEAITGRRLLLWGERSSIIYDISFTGDTLKTTVAGLAEGLTAEQKCERIVDLAKSLTAEQKQGLAHLFTGAAGILPPPERHMLPGEEHPDAGPQG